MPSPFTAPLFRFAERLRFPQLFFLTAGLFLLDLVVPDMIPLADEILLGLLTLLFASWRRRRRPEEQDSRRVVDGAAR